MDNPRVEKVAVVDEVRERLSGSTASVVTEYRGLTVTELPYCACAGLGRWRLQGLQEHLVRRASPRPTTQGSSRCSSADRHRLRPRDVSAVAKALRDFAAPRRR